MEENKKVATKKMSMFLGAVAAVGVVYLAYYMLFLRGTEETENAYIHGNKVQITSQVSGTVKKISIEDTKDIKAKESLVEIDPFDYEIALKTAEAQLGEAVRNYYMLQKNVIINEENLNSAMESFKVAEKTYKRESISHRAGITSAENFDKISANYIQSKNKLEECKANLEISKIKAKSSGVYTHPDVIKAIENYKKAYSNLQKTKVESPVSGKVAQKQIEIGQEVKAGQTLFTVVDLNNIWVEANFKETQLKDIKRGNPVEIKSDVNGRKYEGLVEGVSAGSGSTFSLIPSQNATGNWIKIVQRVPVRVKIKKESLEKNGLLPLGTTLTVKVDTSKVENMEDETTNKFSNLYQINQDELNKKIDEIVKANSI